MNDYQAAMREMYEEGRRAGIEQAATFLENDEPRRVYKIHAAAAIRALATDTGGRDAD